MKAESTDHPCTSCGKQKNVTRYTFNKLANMNLCLGCRKKMAELLKED